MVEIPPDLYEKYTRSIEANLPGTSIKAVTDVLLRYFVSLSKEEQRQFYYRAVDAQTDDVMPAKIAASTQQISPSRKSVKGS